MVEQHSEKKSRYYHPKKTITVLLSVLSAIAVMSSGFEDSKTPETGDVTWGSVNKDSVESVKAFKEVYKVLMSPRCMNCHPAGDVPLQGEDSHLHTMLPKRGADGKGLYAMKCGNCHQSTNAPGLHTPPGNPEWHLPPANMKMVFQGKSARALALQLTDYNRNGHKSKRQLLEHAKDTLVKAGWNMGEGRKPPPLSYPAFVKAWHTWIEKGAYAPNR